MAAQNRSSRQPGPLSGALGRVIKSAGLTDKYHGWMVVTQWAKIVGPDLARVARPERYDDGTLIVAVPDASWRQELSMKQDELLEKIRSHPYGKSITRIRLIQGGKGTDRNGH
ncbi:MAG: DUF721 domain-containing protein [Candidatus Zixiibacteriota bacterium]|nr:MAG: DUF721 domain-containing protein [candidate division Zixibacteria bacterium]